MHDPWYPSLAMEEPDPFIGREIVGGRFLILEKIGTGGMGSVYKAQQPSLNRCVAVKIMHTEIAHRLDLVSRFRHEARAMSHLNHPNTVKVHLIDVLDDNVLCMVMEYLEGKNLHDLLCRGPMPYQRALPMMMQVCGAIGEAHRKGIIHRDLKPENIFLCKDPGGDENEDHAKVLDYGLAKVTEEEMRPDSIHATLQGAVFGTFEFMSPEQARGEAIGPTSDIYSLGVILYEAITGKLPFEAKSSLEYMLQHKRSEPIDLNARVPWLSFPPALAKILAKAMAKNPVDRYQTAADFSAALQTVHHRAKATSNTLLIIRVAVGSLVFGFVLGVVLLKWMPS